MEEKRYTLIEAQVEIRRRECAQGRHSPSTEVRDFSEPLAVWYCDCGDVLYRPEREPYADHREHREEWRP